MRYTATPSAAPRPSASSPTPPTSSASRSASGSRPVPTTDESRLLYELDAFTGSSDAFGVLTSAYFDRQA